MEANREMLNFINDMQKLKANQKKFFSSSRKGRKTENLSKTDNLPRCSNLTCKIFTTYFKIFNF